jgi:3-deoxy-D-manno-octulosonate 8-phosphate phosphatase (KDO 8-P phosphatase)
MDKVNERAAGIRLVIFDVDGVLTDGSLYIDADGRELKAFHSRDGHGMKMLMDSGVEIGIITGRTAAVVDHRMASLGIRHVYQGQKEKLPAFNELIGKLGLAVDQVAYVGDDVVDVPILRRVGLAVTVPEAHDLVHEHVHYVTSLGGGRGAAREVCELIMAAQGTLADRLQRYLDG